MPFSAALSLPLSDSPANTPQLFTLLGTAAVLLLAPALAAPVDTSDDAVAATSSPSSTSITTSSTTTTPDDSSSGSSNNTSTGGGKTPEAIQVANYGAPRCKTAALEDLCISGNAESYCDATGFHCNFMTSCKGVCWCE